MIEPTVALSGLTSRGGLSNWIFFFRSSDLVMLDLGLSPAIKGGLQAGILHEVGTYGPQRGQGLSDDEAWLSQLEPAAKHRERVDYAEVEQLVLRARMMAHQLVLETHGRRRAFSLMNRKEAAPVAELLADRLGEKFSVAKSPPFEFLERFAPFLLQ